jgi:hypothetical protein
LWLFPRDKHLIDIAPLPILSRLKGTYDGMLGPMEMLGGMLIDRIVATADVTATQAKSQMNPLVPHLQTLLAAFWGPGLNGFDLVKMVTFEGHRGLISRK